MTDGSKPSLSRALQSERRPVRLTIYVSLAMDQALWRQYARDKRLNPFWANLHFPDWLREQLRAVAFPNPALADERPSDE